MNKLLESHKNKEVTTDERRSELNQIVANVHDNVNELDDLEPPEINKEDDLEPPEINKEDEHKTSV